MNPSDPGDIAKAFMIKAGIVAGCLFFLKLMADLWLRPKLKKFFQKAVKAIGPQTPPTTQTKPKERAKPTQTTPEARLAPGWEELSRPLPDPQDDSRWQPK